MTANPKSLVPHDGVTEWSVCGNCENHIDWASDIMAQGRDRDDTSCPACGHADTAWLPALEIVGHTIQHDASGQGHAWKNIPAGDVPASILEEIEGEIMDGGRVGETIVASNGQHYRAL